MVRRSTLSLLAAPFALIGCVSAPSLEDHLAAIQARLPNDDFHVVVDAPFIIIGDEPIPVVERRVDEIVRWARRLLEKDFFPKRPASFIDVWLFKNRQSYIRHATALFGSEPSTPYGYYSPRHRAIVMNIETGGGTLVHELVHPYVQANFPKCPAWFNEGLASLYEQCGERHGRMVGFTNWRLHGLQQSIRQGNLPSFAQLTATSDTDFYEMDMGTNYAQARYLCLYLQQRGLLRRFYHAFLAAREQDPTGLATLEHVLAVDDMVAFQREWEEWVLRLRFRS